MYWCCHFYKAKCAHPKNRAHIRGFACVWGICLGLNLKNNVIENYAQKLWNQTVIANLSLWTQSLNKVEREKRMQNLRTNLSLQEVKGFSEAVWTFSCHWDKSYKASRAKILPWMYGKKFSWSSTGISKLFWVFSRSKVQAGVRLSLFFKTEGVFSADDL